MKKNAMTLIGLVVLSVLAGGVVAKGDSPTTIVVGFAPGGTSSSIARFLADSLERMTKSPVVVENHKGASGLVAAEYVKRQKPDGKTLLLLSSTSTLVVSPEAGFTYIALVATYKYMFVTGKQNPESLAGYFAAVRYTDALRNVATAGAGTIPHLIGATLFGEQGASMRHVPFSGSAPAILSVVGGHVASAVVPYPELLSQTDSVRVLAQTGDGIDQEGWIGILAPANTPMEETRRLQELFRAASEDSKVRLESLGFQQVWKPGVVLRSIHEREYRLFKPLLERLGVSPFTP